MTLPFRPVAGGRVGLDVAPERTAPDDRPTDLKLPDAFVAECRAVLAAIRSARPGQSTHILALTSVSPGAGVSTIAWSLARYLARADAQSVLLVDTTRSELKSSGDGLTPGLRDLLRGVSIPTESLTATADGTLSYRGAGAPSETAVHGDQATDLMAALRSRYRYVIIDVAPVLAPEFAEGVVQACDGAIVVMEPHQEDEETAARAVAILRGLTQVLGVVFNKQ